MLTESEAALAREVLVSGPISRRALSRRLGLSPASLTRLAKPFLQRRILVERDEASDGSVGRPSRPLDIAPDLGVFAGVKLTEDHVYAVLTDARAHVLAQAERALPDHSPQGAADVIAATLAELPTTRPNRIGVSVGGIVEDGQVVYAPFLEWTGVDIATLVQARVRTPVSVENDLVALAEVTRWFGPGRDTPGFVVITVGEGIGYALVAHGQVVRSREAGVGLGTHIPLSRSGPLCAAGHRGCAQAMLTSGSIVAQVSAMLQRPVTYEQVLALARAGEPAARAVTDAAADALGRFVALAANLTLQPRVVLAGEGIALFVDEAEHVRAAAEAGRDPRADPLTIFVESAGFTAWARGAAVVAIQAAVAAITLRPGLPAPTLLGQGDNGVKEVDPSDTDDGYRRAGAANAGSP